MAPVEQVKRLKVKRLKVKRLKVKRLKVKRLKVKRLKVKRLKVERQVEEAGPRLQRPPNGRQQPAPKWAAPHRRRAE
jgi:hypothetical protein